MPCIVRVSCKLVLLCAVPADESARFRQLPKLPQAPTHMKTLHTSFFNVTTTCMMHQFNSITILCQQRNLIHTHPHSGWSEQNSYLLLLLHLQHMHMQTHNGFIPTHYSPGSGTHLARPAHHRHTTDTHPASAVLHVLDFALMRATKIPTHTRAQSGPHPSPIQLLLPKTRSSHSSFPGKVSTHPPTLACPYDRLTLPPPFPHGFVHLHPKPNPVAPSCMASMSRSRSTSLLSYSGRSSWLKHVCADGSRSPAPYACGCGVSTVGTNNHAVSGREGAETRKTERRSMR